MSRINTSTTVDMDTILAETNELIEEVYANLQKTVRHQFDMQKSSDQSVQKQDILHEAIEVFIKYIQKNPDKEWNNKLTKDYVFSSIITNFKQRLYNETKRGQVRDKYQDTLKAAYKQRESAEAEQMAERIDVEDLMQHFEKPVARIIETIVDTYETKHGEGSDIIRTLQKKYDLSVRKSYEILNFIREEAKQKGFTDETIQNQTQ